MLPRTNTYVKRYDVYFLVEDEDLLDKYNTISDKVSSGFKKNLIANLYTIKKFLKTKIKTYGDETKDFHNKEMRKTGPNHAC